MRNITPEPIGSRDEAERILSILESIGIKSAMFDYKRKRVDISYDDMKIIFKIMGIGNE